MQEKSASDVIVMLVGSDDLLVGVTVRNVPLCGSHISCCSSSTVIDVHVHKAQICILRCAKLQMSFCQVQHDLCAHTCSTLLCSTCSLCSKLSRQLHCDCTLKHSVGWVLVFLRFCNEPSVRWKLAYLRKANAFQFLHGYIELCLIKKDRILQPRN